MHIVFDYLLIHFSPLKYSQQNHFLCFCLLIHFQRFFFSDYKLILSTDQIMKDSQSPPPNLNLSFSRRIANIILVLVWFLDVTLQPLSPLFMDTLKLYKHKQSVKYSCFQDNWEKILGQVFIGTNFNFLVPVSTLIF